VITMPKQSPADPSAAAAELRELVREAHAAVSDLTRLLREAERVTGTAAREAVDRTMQETVNAELAKLNDHLKAEAEHATQVIEAETLRAREWIIHNLELIAVTETPEGLRAEFRRSDLGGGS
jgi:hypothetical protein